MMTKQEKLIVSAYTGVLMVDFAELHQYIEKLMGRPIWTHELGMDAVAQSVKDKVKPEFLKLCEVDDA